MICVICSSNDACNDEAKGSYISIPLIRFITN